MEPTQGGPEWERNEAAKALADAVAAGDSQAIEQATNRLGDAVVNGASSKLIGGMLTAVGTIVRGEVAPIRAHLEQSDRARIDRNALFQTHIDSRFDAFGIELSKLSALPGEVGAALGTFQESLDEIASEVASVKADVAEQIRTLSRLAQARYAGLEQQIAALSEREDQRDEAKNNRLGSLEQEMQDMRSIIAVLKETIAALTDELTQVREQTIADEITAPDRRKMTADVRLIPAILERLDDLEGKSRGRSG